MSNYILVSHHALNFVLVLFLVSANVTITSSPQLGIALVCDMRSVDLTCDCDADNNLDFTWQCGSNQPQHKKTITVQARLSVVSCTCTCVVSNSGLQLGKADITVVANGKNYS